MPTISTFFGLVIQMFWREHDPPHFHAIYGEHEAVIDIRELRVTRGWRPVAPSRSFSSGPLTTACDCERCRDPLAHRSRPPAEPPGRITVQHETST